MNAETGAAAHAIEGVDRIGHDGEAEERQELRVERAGAAKSPAVMNVCATPFISISPPAEYGHRIRRVRRCPPWRVRGRCSFPDPGMAGRSAEADNEARSPSRPPAVLALGLFFMPPASHRRRCASSAPSRRFVPDGFRQSRPDFVPHGAQPRALSKQQSDALDAYNDAVKNFERSWASGARRSIPVRPLPNLPGQALYLARNAMIERAQGSHRRAAVQDRPAQQVQDSAGLFRRRQ